jgi:hypothetical protein
MRGRASPPDNPGQKVDIARHPMRVAASYPANK